MKHPIAFRVNNETITLLNSLSKEFHISKTEVMEKAIAFYAQEMHENKLLKYAGILKDTDIETMLDIIHSSRYNKELDKDIF